MDTSNKYIVPVQQYGDTEDYFIEIPQEICQELHWQEGDTLDWQIEDQSIIISKIKNDWYSVKAEYVEDYLNSESEGKDFDTYYDDETTVEETTSIEGYELP